MEIEVVEDDTVDMGGIVVVDVVECVESEVVVDEVEIVVTDELGKIRGDSTRVNRTSEDTRMTIMTAPTVTLLVLFIVIIRIRNISRRRCILIVDSFGRFFYLQKVTRMEICWFPK